MTEEIIELHIKLFVLEIYRYVVMNNGLFIQVVKGFAFSRSVGISNSDARNERRRLLRFYPHSECIQ